MAYQPKSEDLSWFFSQVKNIKTLSAEEERELIIATKCGDMEARRKLAWHNIPLIIKEATVKARKHRTTVTHHDEILLNAIQEGMVGLNRAVEEFNVSLGHRLSTFAVHYIRDAVNRVLRFDVSSTKPVKTLDKARSNENFIAFISAMPDFDRVAEDEDSMTVSDSLTHTNLIEKLKSSMKDLTTEEQYIIERRYGFYENPYTYGSLANLLSISMERVRQIENRALKRLYLKLRQDEIKRFMSQAEPEDEEKDEGLLHRAPLEMNPFELRVANG